MTCFNATSQASVTAGTLSETLRSFNVLLNGAENLRATCYFFFPPNVTSYLFNLLI